MKKVKSYVTISGYGFYKYALTEQWYTLDKKDRDQIIIAYMMIRNDWTYRECDKTFQLPIATMCQWIHKRLKVISPEMYHDICEMFGRHKEHYHKKERKTEI